jgi:hypothetical protein
MMKDRLFFLGQEAEGPVCAIGALNVAYNGIPLNGPSMSTRPYMDDRDALAQTATQLFPNRSNASIVTFNNHPDTTQDDLELVFEKTAAELGEPLDNPLAPAVP